jgi:hypothetical protein
MGDRLADSVDAGTKTTRPTSSGCHAAAKLGLPTDAAQNLDGTYLEAVMQMMLKAVVDTDTGNKVFCRGGVIEAVDHIQHVLQPEVLYEYVEDGQGRHCAREGRV